MMNPLSKAWREMVILAAALTTVDAKEIRFLEDDALFPKPESGFYLYQNLDRLTDEVETMRERNVTLIWGKIDLEGFRATAELPETYLEKLDQGFERARTVGAKVIVRASYGHRGPGGDYQTYEDPQLEIIRGHVTQLAPLFTRHTDVIAFFEAGFLGPWGEWHTTAAARAPDTRRAFFMHLLENTPRERMIVVRYPALKQSLFQSNEPLTSEIAYTGEPIARTAHHNDCFLSSPNDVGTYNREGLTMVQEQAYLEADTLHTLFGGESCALHERSLPDVATFEMERLHLSYLNLTYHPDVLKRWRESGFMETVERRMGARFVLESVVLPDKGTLGGDVSLAFTLHNRGFAALYNERPVQLVLRDADGKEKVRFPLAEVDPRRWKPGECARFSAAVKLPDNLPKGNYALHLALPDASVRLAQDPRYAVRFANQDVWEATTGENRLVPKWPIE